MHQTNFLHSIAITNEKAFELGPIIRHHIEIFKAFHPTCKHILWDNEMARRLITERFENRVIRAYEKLIPSAYKADLARLCILYEFGGIYSDLSILYINTMDHLLKGETKTFMFRLDWNPGSVHNAIILTKRKAEIIGELILKVVENVESEYYGETELDPTGPEMISKHLKRRKIKEFGNTKLCLKDIPLQLFYSKNENQEYPIALRYKPTLGAAGLGSLGAKGFEENPYTKAWHNRSVYNEL
ncbi:glycosyltransferase family 32 protein [Synechococcus sp. PROS-U-1]|uniref:glycosyltransferase family 32 protein n=1 Tax=Synechococcus sp. PROS-U-1 TaxID=1400866 RepID=UPI0016469CDF|nr:glycosyltransferase [Synechococcus sp. PROS-U-1]QNJ01761.1 glycosyltransferase sugar-binding region containing DXD motif family protein [Synechococcus sp. PROS-U-1]